ncbi:MAG: hypothetical protein ACKOWC_04985 [Limnohabitans sp.]
MRNALVIVIAAILSACATAPDAPYKRRDPDSICRFDRHYCEPQKPVVSPSGNMVDNLPSGKE